MRTALGILLMVLSGLLWADDLVCPDTLTTASFQVMASPMNKGVLVRGKLIDEAGLHWDLSGKWSSMHLPKTRSELLKQVKDEILHAGFIQSEEPGNHRVCSYQTPRGFSLALKNMEPLI